MKDEDIDYSDIPELDDAFFATARVVVPPGKSQLRRHPVRSLVPQRIEGITGTESYDRRLGGRREYLRSIARVADEIRVRPGYLSESALRRGYQYSRALRWIRFLHGKALHDQGIRSDTLALRIGFADPAGWTRFVKALNGAAPGDLPPLPLGVWVERAIEDVYMGC